jgi:V8-like Glu-specific endopeptidase
VNGVADEFYLGLASEQVRAVVQVVDLASAIDAGGPLCSGTFVAPDWVITAGHCLQIQSAAVIVAGDAHGDSSTTFAVLRSVANPNVDVALLNIDVSSATAAQDGGIANLAPIACGGPGVARLSVGDVVEMAGYGLTETLTVGSLRFLAESITEVDATTITVNGFGASGGCEGDSGGPLLIRGPDGSVTVAGVLSIGSSTCREDDSYVRLDAIQDWIQQTTSADAPHASGCGGVSEQGRCLYGSAMWCAAGQLSADTCPGGTRCGWDTAAMGYRCVLPAQDPCSGVDSFGACRDGAAVSCDDGVPDKKLCGCNPCQVDGTTGRPRCGEELN